MAPCSGSPIASTGSTPGASSRSRQATLRAPRQTFAAAGPDHMCGIAGCVSLDGGPPDVRGVRAMADALAHRGPDGEGFFEDGPVAFGFRRLAIIDLTDAAN